MGREREQGFSNVSIPRTPQITVASGWGPHIKKSVNWLFPLSYPFAPYHPLEARGPHFENHWDRGSFPVTLNWFGYVCPPLAKVLKARPEFPITRPEPKPISGRFGPKKARKIWLNFGFGRTKARKYTRTRNPRPKTNILNIFLFCSKFFGLELFGLNIGSGFDLK